MDVLIKINSQTAGKDKQFRLLQYLLRLVWHRLQCRGSSDIDRIKTLEFLCSNFRKLLRFGKCIDTIYSTLPLVDHPDLTIRYTLSLSKISTSLFLFCDHILWLSRTGLFEINSEKWSKLSSKYWLYSITMNLIRDFYEISNILKDNSDVICQNDIKNVDSLIKTMSRALVCVGSRKDIVCDTIKNSCDFIIPFTALGYTNFTPSTIGALGVISSIAGLIAVVDPKCKLTPI